MAVASGGGERIAFVRRSREIWMMGAGGENAYRIAELSPDYSYESLAWSPDSQWLAWLRRSSSDREYAIEAIQVESGRRAVLLNDAGARTFCWRRSGSLVYARTEAPPNQGSSNLWEVDIDPRTGMAGGAPRRLTNWSGFIFSYLRGDAGGTRLGFIRWRWQSDVMVGELPAGGTHLQAPRRLTADERMDWVGGWTQDSREVLFYSDRYGPFEILRQPLHAREPLRITNSGGENREPKATADGRWILYMNWPDGREEDGRLLRAPITGGPAELVFPIHGYPGSVGAAEDRYLGASRMHPSFRCPSLPGEPCVISESKGASVVFSKFRPETKTKTEVARIGIEPGNLPFWDLSPSGRSIVYGFQSASARLRILRLDGGGLREIDVEGARNLANVVWAANERGFFGSVWSTQAGPLVHITLDGKAATIYTAAYHLATISPSADGRRLAFTEITSDSNAWLIEGPPMSPALKSLR